MGQATTDTSPVLAIASTVGSNLVGKNRGGLHDCGQSLDVMRPLCRYVHRCDRPEEISSTIAELIHALRTSRPGGAYCEIPCDILSSTAEIAVSSPLPCERLKPDARLIGEAAKLLSKSHQPVIWVGTGATISEAGPEVQALASKLGAIVVTSLLGQGLLPSDHPNVIRPDGALLTEVNEVVADADVVLAVGTMFKQEDTADWRTRLGGKLIHMDIDPAELGRSYHPDIGIVGDAKASLTALLEQLPFDSAVDPEWVKRGKEAQAKRLQRRRSQSPLEMQALDILRKAVPRDGILVCDRCNLGYWAYRCLPVYSPRTFQYPMGYGALGGALPQSFGAKLACPDKAVVCVIGDGGFQFTAPELAVATQEDISVTIVLCNNNAYGAIRSSQDRNFGGRRFGIDLVNPDFQKLSSAYGIPSQRVNDLDDFERVLSPAIDFDKLNLIELAVELADPP